MRSPTYHQGALSGSRSNVTPETVERTGEEVKIRVSASLLESPFGMRWTTLVLAVVLLSLIGAWKRRPGVAVIAVLAWVGGFEVMFRALDILRWHEWWALSGWGWEAAALGGWVVAAHLIGIRPSSVWIAVTVVAFAVWWATGYDYNLPQTATGQHQTIRLWPEIENVTAKTGWGIAYLTGALRLPDRRGGLAQTRAQGSDMQAAREHAPRL